MSRKLIEFIIFTISIISIVVSIFVYQSFRLQKYLLLEFNTNNYNIPLSIADALNIKIPNISVTALSMGPLISKYHIRDKDYKGAISKVYETWDTSPYSGFQELALSQIYDDLNLKDSSIFYSRIAFNKLPNAAHFAKYLRDLNKYNDSIYISHDVFQKVKNKNNIQQWKIYLSFLVIDTTQNKLTSKKIAKEALQIFNNSDEIRIASHYILYGKENVDEAVLSDAESQRLFEIKEYDEAIFQLEKAIKLYPVVYSYYENLGILYLEKNRHEDALSKFNFVLDSFNDINYSKSQYLKAITLEKIDNQKYSDEICNLLEKSRSNNYVPAFEKYNTNCK